MRTIGSPAALGLLAVQRIAEGYSAEDVAAFLGVDPRSVRRWAAAARLHGASGLAARPVSGRPPKLSATQEKIIRRWLAIREDQELLRNLFHLSALPMPRTLLS
jgi:transposase